MRIFRSIDFNSQALIRSTRTRTNCGYLPEESVKLRKTFYWKKGTGFLRQNIESNPMSAMMNPAAMTGMLKQSFMSQIYQVGLSFGLGYFFSGFIMAKLPFGLTQKFKVMLHQGFNIPLLDASFVSSLSLAFLFIYGLQGVYGLMFDSNPIGDDLKMMNPQYMMGGMMGGPGGAPGQPKDYGKLFESERENYDILNYEFVLDKAEGYLIKKFKENRLFD